MPLSAMPLTAMDVRWSHCVQLVVGSFVDGCNEHQVSVMVDSSGIDQKLSGFFTSACCELLQRAPKTTFWREMNIIWLLVNQQLDEGLSVFWP